MVSVLHFLYDASQLFKEIQKREDDAEAHRQEEYVAATKIQACLRGFFVRKHMQFLNASATMIQKHWRGFADRRYYVKLLKESVEAMCQEHYNKMALRIQSLWRGYVSRTQVFSFYELKRWIGNVLDANDKLLKQMADYEHLVEASALDALDVETKYWVAFILFKLHHFLRTHACPGIYSLHNSSELSCLEKQLKSLKFTEYMNFIHEEQAASRRKQLCQWPEFIMKGKLHRCEKYWPEHNPPKKGDMLTQGELPEETAKFLKEQQKLQECLLQLHDKPMRFPKVHPQRDTELLMDRDMYHTAKSEFHRSPTPPEYFGGQDFVKQLRPIELFDEMPTATYMRPARPKLHLIIPDKKKMLSAGGYLPSWKNQFNCECQVKCDCEPSVTKFITF